MSPTVFMNVTEYIFWQTPNYFCYSYSLVLGYRVFTMYSLLVVVLVHDKVLVLFTKSIHE